jgi:hypothetical protein
VSNTVSFVICNDATDVFTRVMFNPMKDEDKDEAGKCSRRLGAKRKW